METWAVRFFKLACKERNIEYLNDIIELTLTEIDKEVYVSPYRCDIVMGFDIKCLSCLYLDKPLEAHTLMQTIARTNRVNEGKINGLIIDYIVLISVLLILICSVGSL